jgi:MFS family permease
MDENSKAPLLTPILRWFMFAMIMANIAGMMYPAMLPIYLTKLGASVGQVGLIFTLSSVVILVLQLFGGWVSDSIGRLRSIAIGSVGGILGLCFMLWAPTWQWMVAAISVSQIPYALVGPSFGAFIAENSTPENRGKVYGVTDTIYQVTGIIGPPLGGYLAGASNFKTMLLLATILYSLAAVLRIWMATTMTPDSDRRSEELSWASFKGSLTTMWGMLIGGGVISWIFITDGVRDISFRLSHELIPIYQEQIGGLSLQQIGLLGSFFSIAMMVIPMVSGRLSDRYGERVPIAGGFVLIFGALMVFIQSLQFIGFAAAWAVFGLGVGLLSPAYQSLISKVVPKKQLGVFTGMFRSSLGLISLPAPWLGAQLWENISPQFPFYITAVVSLVSIIPIWLKFKVPEKEPEQEEPGQASL